MDTDVAVIRIPARRLEQVPLARPRSLRARVEATPLQLLPTVVRGRSARLVLVQ
ncbi:MAG TPA: hypothetical protein VFG21_03455 [Xanthomonadaceae bacterium]|nr:hypothetical protein [Xanthomonadaceae bacterium]